MPPPKKPKVGRTSLEQFLSEDERQNVRFHMDSEGHSPTESVEEGSDGEVFVPANGQLNSGEQFKSTSKDESPETLFQKLFRKTSLDEQKVPGSPEQDAPSPPEGGVRVGAFTAYQEHLRLQLEKRREIGVKNECVSPRQEKTETYDRVENEGAFEPSSAPRPKLSHDQGRLIDTLVASALASSAAQSIIYGCRSSQKAIASMANLSQGQNNSFSTCTARVYEAEPHDLSKKSEMTGKLLNHRLFEQFSNTRDTERLKNAYREWALRQNKELTFERSQHYLDTHRRIVGLLSENGVEAQRETTAHCEKENIVQAVPARYPNGFFNHTTLNGAAGGYPRFEHQQRDSIDRTVTKVEDPSCMISVGNYMPVQSMMPPAVPMNQSPTSTTMDHVDPRDRYHPALMSPHFLADSRRMKAETSHGGNVNKLCQVCSDNASGFHYGVWSCEGCKAFFKRSIQGPVDYVCPATNTCTIDKHRRKSCQACRLRKCYEVGMNKGSQRKERKSNGSTQNKSPKRPRSESGDSMNHGVDSIPTPAKNSRKSRTTLIIEALSKADLPNLESYHNHSLPPTRTHLLTSFVKLAEKELVFLINWAKNVPGYTELSLGDQVHLIECCWMELLLLNCAFRSMEHGGRRLVIAPDLILERSYWSVLGMADVLEHVAAISDQLVQYNLHNEELLLLQATVLANAEVRKLASFSKLQEIRQNILDSSVDIAQKYHPDNLRHVPSLILLLTHVRRAAERATLYFQSVKKEGLVPFCDLLTEMLDAQSEEKKPSISNDS
ncbi:estrogen receptor-like isoform X2 [Mercenaria mercenaria]|nr:estrogen receptor-like isoform X2 [Mercenaria mercenaria]